MTIQRWEFGCSNSAAQAHMSVSPYQNGKFVLHADHLTECRRREIEAQIAALEWVQREAYFSECDNEYQIGRHELNRRIAELREELAK